MKAAVFYGKQDIRVVETEARSPKADEIMIRVQACGVCGTDVHIYEGAEGAAQTSPPVILGHEFSGTVHEVGKDVKGIKPGDRVCVDPNDMCGSCYYCRLGKAHFCENMIGIGTTTDGGFAEYCTVREKQVYKIPDHLSFPEAAMAEPLACCLHGMDLAGVTTGQTALIVGGGTIGLIMLQLAKISGAATVILAEPVAAKRMLAEKLGANIVLNPLTDDIGEIMKIHGIKSVDSAIECVGSAATMSYTIEHTSKGGTAMLFGLTDPKAKIDLLPFDLFRREVAIKASFINPYTQSRAVSLLSEGKINVLSLISAEIKLGDISGLFSKQQYKGRGKMVIIP